MTVYTLRLTDDEGHEHLLTEYEETDGPNRWSDHPFYAAMLSEALRGTIALVPEDQKESFRNKIIETIGGEPGEQVPYKPASINKGQAKDLIDDFLYFACRTTADGVYLCSLDDHSGEGVEHWMPMAREEIELLRDQFIGQEVGQ